MSTAWSSEPFGARRGRPFRADAGGVLPIARRPFGWSPISDLYHNQGSQAQCFRSRRACAV
jgi:hypothetical protein